MKKKLCCIFNYAPLYRRSIYLKIDQEFDAQFYFSDLQSDIAKMDYMEFKKYPKTIRDRCYFKKILFRWDILLLPFKKFDYYLIIGDTNISYLFFLPLCHILGKKVFAWGHGCKTFKGKLGLFNKWLYKNCDVYFTYSEGAKDRLVSLGIPSNKISVIYNSLNSGVNIDLQSKNQSDILKNKFKNNYPTLVFVGRLTKVKQLDWILNALNHHNSNNLFYNVLIIGDGPEKEKLMQMTYSLNLDQRVWFYGECYNDSHLSKLLYNSDLCVSPGNVGLTALHSMLYGTPVLSNDDFETQMPEYEIIVPGKTGILYKRDDFEDFCLKIENWLSRNLSRDTIRQNCYKMINDRYNSSYQINLLKETIK